MTFDEVCKYLKEGANDLALHNSEQKNKALACVAESILENKANILEANTRDVSNARAKGMTESLVERLALDEKLMIWFISCLAVRPKARILLNMP